LPTSSDNSVSCEELERVIIGEHMDRYFQVGTLLPTKYKAQLIDSLKDNLDIFAWIAYEAPGIDLEFICHHLNANPSATPKKQLPRQSSKEHYEAIKYEIRKLKQAGAIKEFFYPEWLANTLVVKKKLGKWRVCNKACPKDPFPIPRIDQLVDATFGHPRMSFLDAFQGYHQIPLALSNQEKITFLSPMGNYHYRVMPFGLKNTRSTYQRMMTRMFESQKAKKCGSLY